MSRNPDRLTLAFLSSQIPMDYLLPAFRAQFPTAELRLGEQLGALENEVVLEAVKGHATAFKQ